MLEEKNTLITYQGNQITMFSDGRNDYINLTEIAKAHKNYGRKSINKWIRGKQTIEFLTAWERKNNPFFDGTNLGTILESVKNQNFTLSVGHWIETTKSIGLFTKQTGTFAHKDIAIRFTGWLSPDFELFLVEEIQRLKIIEEQKNSYELLNHDQIIYLIKLKEVFKYVAHQEIVEDAHKEVFAAKSGSKNPFAEFNSWRNKVLDISVDVIDDRIKKYCIDNNIALTKKILSKTKREKIQMLDTYESVRNATWDFLKINGEVNALNLANLVGDIIKTEKGIVLRNNETDLFHTKQDLGQFNDFEKKLSEMSIVKTARQVLNDRKPKHLQENLSSFNKNLKKAIEYNPKEDKE